MMETAKEYLDKLDWAIRLQSPYLNELVKLQMSYDNKIDPATWATHSQVPTAQHFVAVEEALPAAMNGLFPETNGLQLLPQEDDVNIDEWMKAEWALWTQLTYSMKLNEAALQSVKDCMKLGLGYGIVEPFTYTPEEAKIIATGSKRTRIMGTGSPQTGIRYRDISVGRIIPHPEGRDFDGPYATPMFWFFDPHPAWDIEAMYEGTLPNGVDSEELQGSYADVLEMAKTYDGCELHKFASIMEGKENYYADQISRRLGKDEDPPDIPIIKVFEQPGKWTWIVPGRNNEGMIMLQRESEVQHLQSGMIKWSAWPDGKWYNMSTPEADRVRCFAHDLWFNFVIDMMDEAKRNVRIINKSALPPGQNDLADYEDVFVNGSAKEAATVLSRPNIDPALMGMGATIAQLGDRIHGHNDFMQHNVTRGGTQAFQSLLNTMQGRERLGVAILETGALTKIFEIVLNYMQRLVPEEGITLRRLNYDDITNKKILESQTVTPEDLRHSYKMDLDLSTRRMLGGMSFDERLRLHEALKNDPNARPEMRDRIFPVPDGFARRLWKSTAERDTIQAENREMELLNSLQGGAGGAGQAPTPPAGPPAAPVGFPQ